MNETLVYDVARDGSSLFSMENISTLLIVGGFLLMAVPTIQVMRRQPEKRLRAGIGLGLIAVIALAFLVGLPMLETRIASTEPPQSIEGVIGSVTPKLITVGLMKVMVTCNSYNCPAIAVGDRARVEYIDDSGPETDALAQRIWKRSRS